jgi:dTDP-4-amino-4,6-dideoxygalactose transaminase
MKIPLVDLRAQYAVLKPEIDRAIAGVIADAAFIGNASNPYVQRFEAQFAAFTGAKHAIGCANGTDSLEILLKARGVGPGDEVLVPAVSWIATSEAVTSVGAHPVFVDVDRTSYTMDPGAAAARVTARTRAVIPVHLYGQPADMDPILELAERHGLFVLEDCAQAHAATYKGRMVGRLGHAGSFSFYPGKNLGAYGDAGGMITDDDSLAERARMIGQHGQGGAKHDHRIEGRNSRLDGIQAAILSAKLPHLADWTAARRSHAASYRASLGRAPLEVQAERPGCSHVYHLFVVQVAGRDEVAAHLMKDGVSTAVQYPRALPFLTAYARYGHAPEEFPNAARLAARCLSLPMYPELTAEAIECVSASLRAALGAA